MTPFVLFACVTLISATVAGFVIGAFAIETNMPALAFLAGGLSFAPTFLIMGRVWLRGEIASLATGIGEKRG